MDLSKLDLSKSANEGSVLKLVFPADYTDPETGIEYEKGEVITDDPTAYNKAVDKIKGDKKLSNEQKEDAIDLLVKPKAFFVRLLGTDSDQYRKLSNRGLEKAFNSRDKKKKVDIESTQREVAEKFAKCTTECYFIENGKEVPCTVGEVTRLYLQYSWIKEQVDEFINERSNFTKG